MSHSKGGGQARRRPAGSARRPGRTERPAGQRRVSAGPLTIVVARSAGYCYGVERALQITTEAPGKYPAPITTLGPLIHNPAVVEQLAEQGVKVVESVEEASGGTVVVRTHGVAPQVIEEARQRGLTVVDATCPFVTVAQKKASALSLAGYVVLILGEKDHPEVAGLTACAGKGAVVVEDPGALDTAALRDKRVGVVVQTTQSRERLGQLLRALAPVARETLVYNTICEATEQRQEAAREVASEVDTVLVVGGRNSANTRRLAALCREIQPRTYHVERAGEIKPEWFAGAGMVGIAAGASTPDEEIDAAVEVVRRLAAG
jgi:4-hydroxy-3-methylbut-2-en-1-yl diphosphate reductase